MKIVKFWIVTVPRPESGLEDILFETDIKGLALQFRGGLREEEIHAVFTEKPEASKEAGKILDAYRAYQAKIGGGAR